MAPTFVGNPYNNDLGEESDGIEDDQWDEVVGQFPIPVLPGDSTEEDNILYEGEHDDDEFDNLFAHMHNRFDDDDDLDDDDYDFDPSDDSNLLSDDDFEPGPPIAYFVQDIPITASTPLFEENFSNASTWASSTENIAELNEATSDNADETRSSTETNDNIHKPSAETPAQEETVDNT